MKKKKHKFLKRGEGLKRFERGMNAHIPKKENPNRKKESGSGISSKKSMAFTIKPPSPSNQLKPVVRTKPGLPLKLKLNRPKVSADREPDKNVRSNGVDDDPRISNEESKTIDPKYFNPTGYVYFRSYVVLIFCIICFAIGQF